MKIESRLNMRSVREIAKQQGIVPGKLTKIELVRKIQRAEGNFDCFTRPAQVISTGMLVLVHIGQYYGAAADAERAPILLLLGVLPAWHSASTYRRPGCYLILCAYRSSELARDQPRASYRFESTLALTGASNYVMFNK